MQLLSRNFLKNRAIFHSRFRLFVIVRHLNVAVCQVVVLCAGDKPSCQVQPSLYMHSTLVLNVVS